MDGERQVAPVNEQSAMAVLDRCAKALPFSAYRNQYEARNSYEQNKSQLQAVASYLSQSSSRTPAHDLLTADLQRLQREWDVKWERQETARAAVVSELATTTEQAKDAWLKQLTAEQEAAAAKEAAERKKRKQKKLSDRLKRSSKVTAGDSDSDEGEGNLRHAGSQREAKSANDVGMERGSSLLAHLAELDGETPAPTVDPPRRRTPKPEECRKPVASFSNAPFSAIPLAALVGAGEAQLRPPSDDTAETDPVCTLTMVENTPFAELLFTARVSLPSPPEPATGVKGKRGGGKGAPQAQTPQARDAPQATEGLCVVKVTAYRAVLAACYYSGFLSDESPKTAPPTTAEDRTRGAAAVPADNFHGISASHPQLRLTEGEASDDDEEMVLQDTPDEVAASDPIVWGTEGTVAKDAPDNLQVLSAELVAKYEEGEAQAEEEEYFRQGKARDLPPVISRSLGRLQALTDATWVVLMCHGGYFAGAVFVRGEPVVHKAFHRYVVRKKQGGKQSKHDKTGGSMGSAGGQIRRHHELQWKSTVRDIILTWKSHIDAAAVVLFVAPGPENRAILTDFSETPPSQLSLNLGPAARVSPISMADPRVRSAPLTTHRPVFAEVKRVFSTCAHCQIDYYDAPET